jgi:hypothetical protein
MARTKGQKPGSQSMVTKSRRSSNFSKNVFLLRPPSAIPDSCQRMEKWPAPESRASGAPPWRHVSPTLHWHH